MSDEPIKKKPASKAKINENRLHLIPEELKFLLSEPPPNVGKPRPAEKEKGAVFDDPTSRGDKGAPKKRSSMRQYKKEIQGLWRHLHRQLYKVYGGFVVSPNDRGAHIKLWYNGDLHELRLACRKIANTCLSLENALKDREQWKK